MTKPLISIASWAARVLPVGAQKALYRTGPLAQLIRSSLNRAAPEGFNPVTVAGGLLVGCRFELNLQSEKDYWLGTYEPDLQTAITDWVLPGMVAYDVGANIGYLSVMLARAVGETGSVFAFEALPHNLDRLEANLKLNELSDRVLVISGAVSDRGDLQTFLIGPSGGTGKAASSAGREFDYRETIQVLGICLDTFIYQEGHPAPQIVKMDIEGGEVKALPGMTRALREARPVLLLELHGPRSAQVSWEILTEAGYMLHRMEKGYPPIPSPEALDWKAYVVASPGER